MPDRNPSSFDPQFDPGRNANARPVPPPAIDAGTSSAGPSRTAAERFRNLVRIIDASLDGARRRRLGLDLVPARIVPQASTTINGKLKASRVTPTLSPLGTHPGQDFDAARRTG